MQGLLLERSIYIKQILICSSIGSVRVSNALFGYCLPIIYIFHSNGYLTALSRVLRVHPKTEVPYTLLMYIMPFKPLQIQSTRFT